MQEHKNENLMEIFYSVVLCVLCCSSHAHSCCGILVVTTTYIQACADKLRREMEDFGFPPNFPKEVESGKEADKKVIPSCLESACCWPRAHSILRSIHRCTVKWLPRQATSSTSGR